MIDLIFTHCKEFMYVAKSYGFKTGANQSNVNNFDKEFIDFLDNDFRNPKYDDLFLKVKKFLPEYLVLADIYDNTNIENIKYQIEQIRKIRNDTKIILAIKTDKYLNEFDKNIIYGIPVPSMFGDKDNINIIEILNKISNRNLHLLGGDIYKQFEIYDIASINKNVIVSIDSNYAGKLANKGVFYNWRNNKFSTFKDFSVPDYWTNINVAALNFSLLVWKNMWIGKINEKKNTQIYFS